MKFCFPEIKYDQTLVEFQMLIDQDGRGPFSPVAAYKKLLIECHMYSVGFGLWRAHLTGAYSEVYQDYEEGEGTTGYDLFIMVCRGANSMYYFFCRDKGSELEILGLSEIDDSGKEVKREFFLTSKDLTDKILNHFLETWDQFTSR